MKLRPRIRICRKVPLAAGRWQLVSLPWRGNTWIWDPRLGTDYLKWWQAPQRRRQSAGSTPAEALNALKRKQWELAGQAGMGDVAGVPAPAWLDHGPPPPMYAETREGAGLHERPQAADAAPGFRAGRS